MQSFMTFNKETVVLDQNINILVFNMQKIFVYVVPSLSSIGKWGGQLKTTKRKIWDLMILEL